MRHVITFGLLALLALSATIDARFLKREDHQAKGPKPPKNGIVPSGLPPPRTGIFRNLMVMKPTVKI